MRPLVREAAEERARVLVALSARSTLRRKARGSRKLGALPISSQDAVVLEIRRSPKRCKSPGYSDPCPYQHGTQYPQSLVGAQCGVGDPPSGCGMMPTTLRSSLQTPAMSFADPFGFLRGSAARHALLPPGSREPLPDRQKWISPRCGRRARLAPRRDYSPRSRACTRIRRGHGRGRRQSACACCGAKRLARGGPPGQDLKPLQTPSTGPPPFANSSNGPMTFAKRAMAPGLR